MTGDHVSGTARSSGTKRRSSPVWVSLPPSKVWRTIRSRTAANQPSCTSASRTKSRKVFDANLKDWQRDVLPTLKRSNVRFFFVDGRTMSEVTF